MAVFALVLERNLHRTSQNRTLQVQRSVTLRAPCHACTCAQDRNCGFCNLRGQRDVYRFCGTIPRNAGQLVCYWGERKQSNSTCPLSVETFLNMRAQSRAGRVGDANGSKVASFSLPAINPIATGRHLTEGAGYDACRG